MKDTTLAIQKTDKIVYLKIDQSSSNKFEYYNELLQTVSVIIVLITLVYLANQNRIASRNAALGSFQHIYNQLNDFNVAINQSSDLSKIIVEGRKSYLNLSEYEQLRFEHTYGWLLNILEGWQILITESRMTGTFKDKQEKNLKSIIEFYFIYVGVFEFWQGYQSMYTIEIIAMVNESLLNLIYLINKFNGLFYVY